MATGRDVTVVTTTTDNREQSYNIRVWDGVSFHPMEGLQTKAELEAINYPLEGEAHIVQEDGCLYVYTKKYPCEENCTYVWKNMGRVTAEAPWETWAKQPENIGKGERDFLNWLQSGIRLVVYNKDL